MTTTRSYRSIFLSPEWAHQRYYGWTVTSESPGLRLMQRPRGPVRKSLILLTADGEEGLKGAFAQATAGPRPSEVVIHDFEGVLGNAPVVDGRRLHRARSSQRLLNVATIAIDLMPDDDELLAGMSSNYRREIQQAEQTGVQIEIHERPSSSLFDGFIGSLGTLAAERGFDGPRVEAMRRMFEAGDALLFVARDADGGVHGYVHVYTADRTRAYFMSGVNLGGHAAAGKLTQWAAIRRLKAEGYEWYDLGGVGSQRPDDGIYNFKRRFGGIYVDLGTEWRHADRLGAQVLALGGSLRRAVRAVSR